MTLLCRAKNQQAPLCCNILQWDSQGLRQDPKLGTLSLADTGKELACPHLDSMSQQGMLWAPSCSRLDSKTGVGKLLPRSYFVWGKNYPPGSQQAQLYSQGRTSPWDKPHWRAFQWHNVQAKQGN